MPTKLVFVCVGNVGRSQMATALAERERDKQNLDVKIVTGGSDLADHVHEEVVEALQEEEIDISDRQPRKTLSADISDADYVVIMGCSIEEFRSQELGWRGGDVGP